jgi:hypothetical protein
MHGIWNIYWMKYHNKFSFLWFPFNLTRKIEKKNAIKKKIGFMGLHLVDKPFQFIQDAYSIHKKLGDTQKNIKRHVICMFI